MSHIFNDARQDRYNDDSKNDKGKVLSNNGQVAEKISRKGAYKNPCDSSYDIVAYEPPIGHAADACHKRCEGSNNRNKACYDDRFTAILLVKLVGSVQVFPVEKTHLFFVKDLRPHV